MNKIAALFALFRKGAEVANPEAWKLGQLAGNAVGAFILAMVGVANAFGVTLDVDGVTAMAIGGGFATVYNGVFTVITSKRVGLPAPSQPETVSARPDTPDYRG